MRLQTAGNMLDDIRNRSPLKHQIIPAMQGVMGGDKANKSIIYIDKVLDHVQKPKLRGPSPRLPQISELRFQEQDQRRAMSIPPKRPTADGILQMFNSQEEAL